jgi:hypothetical protein
MGASFDINSIYILLSDLQESDVDLYFITETFRSSEVDEIARRALLVSLKFFFKEILDMIGTTLILPW